MVKLIASADTFVEESSPDAVHGREDLMLSGGRPDGSRKICFVRFDLRAIPRGSLVEAVELDLNANSLGSAGEARVSVSAASQPWDESALTWKTRPPEEPGFEMAKVFASSGSHAWFSSEFPAFTAKVQSWVDDPSANNGFEICLDPSSNGNERIDYHTREAANRSWTPMMAIVYRPPDAAGNPIAGPAAQPDVKVKSEASIEPAIRINGGSIVAWSPWVTLTGISAKDSQSGVAEMRFSNDGRTWSDWEPYATNKAAWDLRAFGGVAGTDGLATVSVQFRDVAGNTSAVATSTIRLVHRGSAPLPPSNLRTIK